ncbi:hypothetical protein Godav_024974, partial [Gossypium davidsonii]|nr:hypothetical protein [Gossypium davidsonii]
GGSIRVVVEDSIWRDPDSGWVKYNVDALVQGEGKLTDKVGVLIESDAVYAVKWCSDDTARPWDLAGSFGNVKSCDVLRETNIMADS